MAVLILIVLGLCFGSFITALVWRLYEQPKHNKSLDKQKLSIVRGRSMCENCHHVLMPLDLVPVFSWLALGGKCRYCRKSFSVQNPLIELSTAILFVFSYLAWPYGFKSEGLVVFSIWLAILVCLIALAIYDIRWKLLPNKLVFPVVFLAAAIILIKLLFYHAGASLIYGSFFGVLLSAGVFYALFILSQGKWIGGGDVKLAVGLGLLIGGPSEAILMLFGASALGMIISLPLIFSSHMKFNAKIPFGPLLIASTIVCYFYGTDIVNWYSRIFIR